MKHDKKHEIKNTKMNQKQSNTQHWAILLTALFLSGLTVWTSIRKKGEEIQIEKERRESLWTTLQDDNEEK